MDTASNFFFFNKNYRTGILSTRCIDVLAGSFCQAFDRQLWRYHHSSLLHQGSRRNPEFLHSSERFWGLYGSGICARTLQCVTTRAHWDWTQFTWKTLWSMINRLSLPRPFSEQRLFWARLSGLSPVNFHNIQNFIVYMLCDRAEYNSDISFPISSHSQNTSPGISLMKWCFTTGSWKIRLGGFRHRIRGVFAIPDTSLSTLSFV